MGLYEILRRNYEAHSTLAPTADHGEDVDESFPSDRGAGLGSASHAETVSRVRAQLEAAESGLGIVSAVAAALRVSGLGAPGRCARFGSTSTDDVGRRGPPFWNGRDSPGNSVFLGRLADDGRLVAAEELLGLVHVVGSAPQGDVLDCRRPVVPIRLHVVQFEERSRAATSLPALEGALPAVTPPHRAPDVRGNVARSLLPFPGLPGSGRRRLPLPLDLAQQKGQGAVEDRGGVAVTDLPSQQVLDLAELVMCLLRHRELHAVTLWRQRCHDRTLDRWGSGSGHEYRMSAFAGGQSRRWCDDSRRRG